jgi:hypothetical protein
MKNINTIPCLKKANSAKNKTPFLDPKYATLTTHFFLP